MEADYQKIVESVNDGVVIIDEAVIKYINPYAAEKLGYDRDFFINKNFLDFVYEEDKEKVRENYKRTMEGRQTFLYDARLQKKDGNLVAVEIHAQKIEYEEKKVDLVVMRDVSARKKAEEVFHQQEERFHNVTENVPDIVARFDKEGRYVYINAAGEEAFGVPKEKFFWKTDYDLGINDERTEAFQDAIDFVFKIGRKKTFYSETLTGKERKYYYTVLVPEFFRDGEVNSVLSITRDITEIKEIDQIKSEFISITSHQLRSPLSIINWCSLSLLRGDAGSVSGEKKEYLERIHDSVKKLIKITDVFLNTTMLDLEMFTFNPRETDVVEVAKEIKGEFIEMAKRKNINFVEEYDDISLIRFDPRILKIIFRGVLSNAIEYTPEKGNVYFGLRKEKDESLMLEVGDSGCGVPKEEKEKVFTKFYRAKVARNVKTYGTGLDLYLIKSILTKIGGSIEIQSPNPRFNEGTVFYIKIPISIKETSF